MRLAIVVSALLILPVSGISGQGTDLAPGSRVRVTSNVHGYNRDVATVSQIRGDTVVLLFSGKPSSVALADLSQVQVSAGTRSTVGRNMGLGALIGFAGGAVLGLSAYEDCDGWCMFGPSSRVESAAWGGAVFGVIGGVVGGVLGAFNRTERWQAIHVPGRVSVAPTAKGGVAVSLTRSF